MHGVVPYARLFLMGFGGAGKVPQEQASFRAVEGDGVFYGE